MKDLWLCAQLDLVESLRARWFWVYSLIFGGIVALLLVFGLTESRVFGFTGLSRLLITYIQLCMAILPVFVLISTVRSVAGDREAGVFEYLLSLPVSLSGWYWGRLLGRFIAIFLPVFLAMFVAIGFGAFKGLQIPWVQVFFYIALLIVLAWCFLGLSMLISSFARSVDIAQGLAFVLWLVLLLFLDLILLGVMIRQQLPAETVIAIALINPLQVFRTAAMLLFDPQLVLLGPAAYLILDEFGQTGYFIYAVIYPAFLGTLAASTGYWLFRRSDLP
jgi:ABC-2 type transport system permease protein